MVLPPENDERTADLLRRAREGDRRAVGDLFERHRGRLRRMVRLRLDRRLRGRLGASDVVQEAYLEASERLADHLENPTMPFFLWLRFITSQKLLALHRHHLGVQMRDAGREVSLHQGALPEASSAALAAQLLGRLTTPSEAAVRAEMKIRLQEALDDMDPLDREVVALRHFEHLTHAETAQVLGIDESAASKRYVRALRRLKRLLVGMPGAPGRPGGSRG